MARVAALAVILVLIAVGCGEDEAADRPASETQTVMADGLAYRVVMFRQLNPRIAPDPAHLIRDVATGLRL